MAVAVAVAAGDKCISAPSKWVCQFFITAVAPVPVAIAVTVGISVPSGVVAVDAGIADCTNDEGSYQSVAGA